MFALYCWQSGDGQEMSPAEFFLFISCQGRQCMTFPNWMISGLQISESLSGVGRIAISDTKVFVFGCVF